jgi:hypothetical protein
MTAKTPSPGKGVPSAKSIGANESNTSRAKLLRMGQNPTLVGKGPGVRNP